MLSSFFCFDESTEGVLVVRFVLMQVRLLSGIIIRIPVGQLFRHTLSLPFPDELSCVLLLRSSIDRWGWPRHPGDAAQML